MALQSRRATLTPDDFPVSFMLIQKLSAKETTDRFTNGGMEVIGGSPARFSAAIKSEVARMDKVIKGAGIRAE